MVSISPTDGQGFCHCENCRPFIEQDPHGQESFIVNILEFYNEVARRVGKVHPGKTLSGYAYGRNAYPPRHPIPLEPNLFVEWAPLNYYGAGLYKSGYWKEFPRVAAEWRAMGSELGYQDYVYWHRSENGAPYAAPLPILKMQFATLKKYGFQEVQSYGCSAWGYGGPLNYLIARLAWDPAQDVVEVLLANEPDAKAPWHLAVSDGNVQWDGLGVDASKNFNWESAVKRSAQGWSVEIAVPFASLGGTAPVGRKWRANLARETGVRVNDEREYSSWNRVEKRFDEPGNFGEWLFLER